VLAGWADDDGMIVPESIPTVSPFKLQQWRGRSMSYAELAFEVFSLFVSTEVAPLQCPAVPLPRMPHCPVPIAA